MAHNLASARNMLISGDRASRLRLLAAIWIGFVLAFFTFSTTQEYYSMPCYPAFALLLGMAMAESGKKHKWSLATAAAITGLCCTVTSGLLAASWNLPAPGDIARALTQHPSAYTLSLGHMGDLTIHAFAYLRLPLILATVAFAAGCIGTATFRLRRAYLLHAARLAMVAFDPYLSSRPLAGTLLKSPPGRLIFDDQFYTFSSVAFYTGRAELLLNGRVNNLEYGSNAPDAPQKIVDQLRYSGQTVRDEDLARLWPLLHEHILPNGIYDFAGC